MTFLLRVAVLLLLLCGGVLAVLFFMQDRLILFPGSGSSPGRPSAMGWGEPWIEDGAFLGRSYQRAGPVRGTVLVYHGNAGTIDGREALAQVLAARGLRVVLAEYPGYGERAGKATLHNVLSGSLDAFVHARRRWDGPLYLAGESLGAGIAAQVAGRHPHQVAGVLLFTPWDSLFKLANANFYGLPVGLALRHHFDSAAALRAYRGKIVIIAAGQDTLIAPAHARALAAALPGSIYVELPGAGHNSWFGSLADADWDRLLAALSGSAGACCPA